MTATSEPGALIVMDALPNMRDLGGWQTPNGPVKRGVVYRSAEFSNLAGQDLARFTELGISTVFDFRTAGECADAANHVPAGVDRVWIDLMRDSKGTAPTLVLQAMESPHEAQELFGDGRAEAMFVSGYRDMIDLPSARQGYAEFFTALAEGSATPALFHCTTGKDRTGWAAASLLTFLGVSPHDVMKDFMLTNTEILSMTQPTYDAFAARGGDPALLAPALGVREEYLHSALDEMHKRYGSIHHYFSRGLGLDHATLDALRATFLPA